MHFAQAASAHSGMVAGLLAVAGLIGLSHWHSLRGVPVAASGGLPCQTQASTRSHSESLVRYSTVRYSSVAHRHPALHLPMARVGH